MKVDRDAIRKLNADEGEKCVGYCEKPKQKIVLDSELGPDTERDTLLHEVLHALFFVASVDVDEDLEEKIVTQICPFLLQVIRDNEDFTRYLRAASRAKR